MRFGAHVSAAGGVAKALDRAAQMGADAAQIFLSSPRSWSFKPPDPLPDVPALMAMTGITSVVVHASYLINIASLDDALWTKSVSLLSATLQAAHQMGIEAVILHPGSHRGSGLDSVMPRWASAIGQALEKLDGVSLLLENTAGGGGTLGRNLDEIALLADVANNFGSSGICLDTQHLFASGYDLRDLSTRASLADELHNRFGSVTYLHLNDSKTDVGSNHDRHENIGEGKIGATALAAFLALPVLANAIAILEVPGDGTGPRKEDIAAARTLAP